CSSRSAVRVCTEQVSMIPADSSLVRHARQPARSGQNAKQGEFRQTDRGGAVVHENDFIASQRQFITPSGRRAIARSKKLQSGVCTRVFNPVPSFICKFAEVHFPCMRRKAEHID